MNTTTVPAASPAKAATAEQAAQVWWLFVGIGILWLVFALLVFRVDATTVKGIAALTGVFCIGGGCMEFVTAAAYSGAARLLRIALGLAFLVIGGLAFAHPQNTFGALATIFAFYLLLGGVAAIVTSLLDRHIELWWALFGAGVVQVLLAFWAAGNFGHKAFLLIVWIGASALAAGITQIVRGFQLRSARPRLSVSS
ncbi:MAG TPA: DUF308 domain-containing protein [Gaiellaceae bacterium]|nr:DUF308 domain-containing protein [Gaiellaceae bacterium]